MLFLPYFISWVVVGAIAYNLFNYDVGTLNVMLKGLGLEPVDIYNTPSYWPVILVLVSAWKTLGYGSVMYLVAITELTTKCMKPLRLTEQTCSSAFCILLCRICSLPLLFWCRLQWAIYSEAISECSTIWSATTGCCSPPLMSLIPSYSGHLRPRTRSAYRSAAGFYQSVLGFATILLANYAVRKYDKDHALF